MSTFERRAVQRVIDKALAMGVDVPPSIMAMTEHSSGNGGAIQWTRAHPDDDESLGCCWGDVIQGPGGCTCWVPVWNADQADPIPPTRPEDIQVQKRMCGDCAFELGPVPALGDDTRQLAIQGVHRRVPAEDVAELLDILGLGRPAVPPVPKRLDGSRVVGATKRYCGCGREIRAAANAKCNRCLKAPGQRRVKKDAS